MAAVRKREKLEATMSGSDKKVNWNTYNISSIKRVTKEKKCMRKCVASAKLFSFFAN